ncbi:MAG: hypothetical protein IJC37_02405 [Clostridia bacterium]|nr:hypothetical protein [Clostridia bacterium]MBQ4338254.1 hypothetical protein [Clostridia bacterium]
MKKSIRILSIILALSMLLGNLAVMGSAYQAYTGAAITDYDDVDKATFTTEQYASMALDELDRMLAKEQIVLTEEDIFVGTIDLSSANTTFSSVVALVDSADQLLGMLGDGAALPEMVKELCIDGNKTPYKRSTINDASGNCSDLQMLTALINLVSCDTTLNLVNKFVNGDLSLGMLDALIAGIIDIDVRELVMGLLYGIMDDEFDADEDTLPYTSVDVLLQDLIHYALIGDTKDTGSAYIIEEGDHEGLIWDFLKDLDYASVKEIYTATNVIETGMTAYELIEQILRLAYNYIAVPELNNVTRPWLREICGVTYVPEKMDPESDQYVEDYDGEILDPSDVDNVYAEIFDYENMYVPEIRVPAKGSTITRNGVTMNVTEDVTFISYFNDALYEFLNCILKVDEGVEDSEGRVWTWITCEDTEDYNGTWFGTDGYLLANIASVARYVLGVTGDVFFADYIETHTYQEYMQMSDQEIYAFVLRNLLNASVDWMYIDDTNTTLADVGYAAVEQLAWQDLPQYTYTKPTGTPGTTEYHNAIIEACLDILMDVAVFNINKSIDMVPAARKANQSPAVATDSGLLEFEHDYEKLVLQIAVWGVCNYGAMLTGNGLALDAIELDKFGGEVGNLTITDVWEDIDLIINSIFPISTTLEGSSSVWLYGEIAESTNANGGSDVIRSLIFDYIVNPVLELNATNIEKILTKNTSGSFATDTVLKVLIDLVTNVINLIFPGTIVSEYASLDAVLVNTELGGIATRLLKTFGTHFGEWAAVVLPVVCDLLGLTDAQQFEEMEINLPEIIGATEAAEKAPTFTVYNGCSGLNTGHTNEIGTFIQDQLYKYVITGVRTTTYVNGSATTNVSATGIQAGDEIDGGGFKNVTLSGTFTPGSMIEFTVFYDVLNEIGQNITKTPLAATKYAYVGQFTEGDDVRKTVVAAAAPFKAVEYAPAIYIGKGEGLGEAGDYTFNVKREEADGTGNITVSVTGISGVDWLQLNSDTSLTSYVTENGNATYVFAPFEAKDTYVRYYEAYETVKEATEETFAAREVDWYVKNEYNTYSKVSAGAAFDEEEVYYTYTNNSENMDGPEETQATTVSDGVYNATITVNVNGTNFNLPVTIFLYNDYDLGSAYSNAVRANRQQTDYNQADSRFDGLWSNYKLALQNAGNLVLAPKSLSTFESNKATTNANYPNKYAELYDALADAIEALDDPEAELKVSAGVSGLEEAIATYGGVSNSYYLADISEATYEDEVAGWNNVKYYATDDTTKYRRAYHFFSNLDYVPHTYYTYTDAKDRAQDIINSQIVYPPVRPEAPEAGANIYEQTQYQEAMKLYNEAYEVYEDAVKNLAPASPVEVAYALHMVEFTGGRLIPLDANKDKLNLVLNLYGNETNAGYSATTWEAYQTAVAFANSTRTNGQAKPSQVNIATGELVKAYKELVAGLDYTALENAILAAEVKIDEVELNADGTQSVYSEETWKELIDAYDEAVELLESDLGLSTSNEERVADSVQRIADAIANLQAAASDPVWEIVTEETDPDGWFFDDGDNFAFPYIQSMMDVDVWGEEPFYNAVEGIGPYQNGEESVSHIIAGDENTVVEFVPREDDDGSGWLTTGSKILVKDMSDNVVATYYPVLIGDVSGDAEMGNADVKQIAGYGVITPDYFWEWEVGMEGEPQWNFGYASDINYDGEVSEADAVQLRRVVGGLGYVAQGNWNGDRGYVAF